MSLGEASHVDVKWIFQRHRWLGTVVPLVVPFHDFRTVLTSFDIVCTWFVMSRTLGAGNTLSFQMLHSMAEQGGNNLAEYFI